MLTRGLLTADRSHRYVLYAVAGHKTVAGAMTSLDIALTDSAAHFQQQSAVHGPVVAIGPTLGSQAVLLSLLRRYDECGVAIITGDGRAATQFDAARRRWDPRTAEFRVLCTDAKALDAAAIQQIAGEPPRLILVSGGSVAGDVHNLLDVAADSLADRGILLVNDCFNECLPAVNEGALRLWTDRGDLRPLLTGGNTTLVCQERFAEAYRNQVFQKVAVPSALPWVLHENDFLGRRLLSFRPHDRRWAAAFWFRFLRARVRRAVRR